MFRQILIITASLLSFAVTFPANAQDPVQAPGYASAKSESGCFGATTLLTDDPEWKAKWDALKEGTPEYSSLDSLDIGAKATLVLLFSCPELIEEQARIECDLKMTREDGSTILQQGAVPCFQGRLTRPKEGNHLAQIWLDFDVTPEDGTGKVDIRVGLTDRNIGERISLTFPVNFTGKPLKTPTE